MLVPDFRNHLNSMFKIFGTGRLTKDPEIRVTPKGVSITNSAIAVNRTFKDAENKVHEETDFWNLKVLGQLGENFAKHLRKGSKIVIHGDISQDHWVDKQSGEKRSASIILVQGWEFAESKKTESAVPAGAADDANE